MNDQRKVIYEQRIELIKSKNISEIVKDMRDEVIDTLIANCIPEKAFPDQWNSEELTIEIKRIFNLDLPIIEWASEEGIADQEIKERVSLEVNKVMSDKLNNYGAELWNSIERHVTLQVLDQHWKDHLLSLDHLRQGIGLRAYGQKDPLNEYKSEAFSMFQTMLYSLRENLTLYLSQIEIETKTISEKTEKISKSKENDKSFAYNSSENNFDVTNPDSWGKVGRNAPCPCNSGKKYKHCHGKL